MQDALDFAQGLLKQKGHDAEAFLLTFHVVRDGKILHTFNYQDFPTGDWGSCLIATAIEAKNAQLTAQSGNARV